MPWPASDAAGRAGSQWDKDSDGCTPLDPCTPPFSDHSTIPQGRSGSLTRPYCSFHLDTNDHAMTDCQPCIQPPLPCNQAFVMPPLQLLGQRQNHQYPRACGGCWVCRSAIEASDKLQSWSEPVAGHSACSLAPAEARPTARADPRALGGLHAPSSARCIVGYARTQQKPPDHDGSHESRAPRPSAGPLCLRRG